MYWRTVHLHSIFCFIGNCGSDAVFTLWRLCMKSIKGTYCRKIFKDASYETETEMEEILDFANMVFSMDYGCIDFAALFPKAYSEKRCGRVTHHMIKEKGKIRALADSYPFVMRLKAGQGNKPMELKAAYIGTVAVHPGTRGKGYMTELMERAGEDAVRQGCALMIVDGDRHRYRHCGFERAGIRYSFSVGMGSIMHCCRELYSVQYMDSPVYSFEEVDEESPYTDCMYKLYMRRNVTARSREDFFWCLKGNHAVIYAVLKDDIFVGYVSLSEDGRNVLEFEVHENAELPRIIYDLMEGIGSMLLGIDVGMDESGKLVYLEKMCDYCNASMSHQIKILDYEVVLRFLFNWKHSFCKLDSNDYVIGVEIGKDRHIENYLISVKGSTISVERTDRKTDTVLGELELVSVLTTNVCFVEQLKGSGSKIKNAPTGWFPLPFYLPDADAF